MTIHSIARRGFLAGGAASFGALSFGSGAFAQAKGLPIRVANAAGNVNLAMHQLMIQQGYLQEFGLDPNVITVADGAKIVGGLVGGDLDISTMSGFGQIFPADEKGGKMKILGGAALLPSLALFTSKPNIRTLKDLEGKVVGSGAVGSLVHQLSVALLMKKGVDYKKVQFANIGASGDVFRAVTVGTVDAGVGEVSFVDQQEKFKVRLLPEANMSIELPEYTYQGAYTTEKAIETKRDLLVRTMAAYAKLYRFVHKPEAKEAFFRARAETAKNATVEENEQQWAYLQKYKPYAENLELSEERIRYMQQLNVELGVQKAILPFSQVADMSIARDAIKLLGGPSQGARN